MIKSDDMPPRSTKLLRRLKRWCDQERGRRTIVANHLGIQTQALSNLLGGRQQLTGEQALALLEFLNEKESK